MSTKNRSFLSEGEAVLIFPERALLIRASEGTGDNLLGKDIRSGYVDYIDWTSYSISLDAGEPELEEHDGGMALFREPISDLPDELLITVLKREAGIGEDEEHVIVKTA